MARLLRVEYAGAIHHVTCRMVGDDWERDWDRDGAWPPERRLFRDDRDYWRFLDCLGERVESFQIRLYLFACMTNHFHLVFETPKANCGRFMQALSTAYTVYHNRRHRRHGHLLDGRYKARLVDDAEESQDLGKGRSYLLSLSRYVHLNPVQVAAQRTRPLQERLDALRTYRWSSYPGYVRLGKPFDWVDYAPILGQLAGPKRSRVTRYREFVESGLAEDDEAFSAMLYRSRRAIGGEDFRLRTDDLYRKRILACRRPEDTALRRVGIDMPPHVVLDVLAQVLGVEVAAFKERRRSSPLRAIAARFLTRYAGLTQRETADLLGCNTGAAISQQLARLPERLKRDSRLARQVDRIESKLAKLTTSY